MTRARVRRLNGLAAVLSAALTGAFGVPQASAQTQTQPPLPVATAATVTTPVRLDGVLDDAAWAQAQPIKGMLQVEPVQGAAPSEDTEVRVVYTPTTCTSGSSVATGRRPASSRHNSGATRTSDVDDQVVIVIDPFSDQRNGFFFAVNPAGARRDGQISNNSQEMSTEWDGIWDAPGAEDPGGLGRRDRHPVQDPALQARADDVGPEHRAAD